MKKEDLITYCGIYGGTCACWQDYSLFRDNIRLIAKWFDSQGYQYWMPRQTKEFNYDEFRKGLEFFGSNNTWLVCKKCCKGGDGNPDCGIRKCCEKRRLDNCFECDEFPCKLTGKNKELIQRAERYKTLGKSKWLSQEVEKAKQGYEHHGKKYYQICARATPPKT